MTPYLNLGGNSDVLNYENTAGLSQVQFRDLSTYLYTDASAGPDNIVVMQALGLAGQGLNSFINFNTSKKYASKSP